MRVSFLVHFIPNMNVKQPLLKKLLCSHRNPRCIVRAVRKKGVKTKGAENEVNGLSQPVKVDSRTTIILHSQIPRMSEFRTLITLTVCNQITKALKFLSTSS